jgi:nitronate monooxygenase
VLAQAPDGSPIHRYDATPPMPGVEGDIEALALYSGQSAALVEDLQPAAVIVEDFVSHAAAALDAASPWRRPLAA